MYTENKQWKRFYFEDMTKAELELFEHSRYVPYYSDEKEYNGPDGNTYVYCAVHEFHSGNPREYFDVYTSSIDTKNSITLSRNEIHFTDCQIDMKTLKIMMSRFEELGWNWIS